MTIPTELGPVEYLVIGFQNGQFDGSALAEVGSLQERGIIRVLDLVFVSRAEDGSITWLDYDASGDIEIGGVSPELAGMLSEDDLTELAGDLLPGQAIAVMVFEDTWAVELQQRLAANGGQLLEASRVPKEAVDEVLAYAAEAEALESADTDS